MVPDERLVKKSKAGNKRAFGKLVKIYQDKILYLCYDLLGDYDEAKDAAQDVFMKAYEKIETFQEKSKFSTWLYRIAVNRCTDLLRKKSRHQVFSLDAVSNEHNLSNEFENNGNNHQSYHNFEKIELKDRIDKLLENLSEQQRTVVVLKYFQELSSSEIAEMLECSIDTVRVHLHRAFEKLRKSIKNKT